MKIHPYLVCFAALAVCVGASYVWGEVRVCPLFSENMVIQRDAEVAVWGWAQKGEKIVIKASWSGQTVVTTTDGQGRWTVKIKTPPAGGPYEISIEGSNSLTIKNILAGDVWLSGGQSNMSFELNRCSNAATEIPKARYPTLRLFRVISTISGQATDRRQTDFEGQWLECTPESAAEFSGVSYFFGRNLTLVRNIPIGLIQTSVGGTPIAAWISMETLKSDPAFEPILAAHAQLVADYPQTKKVYDEKLQEYQQKAARAESAGSKLNEVAPKAPLEPYHFKRPAALYNRYIAPLEPFAIKGVIWYQGEADSGRWLLYRKLFPALIENWRKDFGQGDFPFLFVQYAGFDNDKASNWPLLRESQAMALSVPNTAMASAVDMGEPNDIHPPRKEPVGVRLAIAARAVVYGEKMEYSGPVFKAMEFQGGKAVLEFTHIGSGLVLKETPVAGFQIAGKDQIFFDAAAKIDGNKVIVSSSKVAEPVAVRYAWHRYPHCSLYNKEDLPAPPFRTDTWLDPAMQDASEPAPLSTISSEKGETAPRTSRNQPVLSEKVKAIKDVDYLESGRKEKMDLYYPADRASDRRLPAVLVIHGGGWVEGDKVSKRDINIISTLGEAGFICASINYKLGNNSWPQNLYDCKAAVRFLRVNADKYGLDPNNIGVIGGSAGGHLAAMVALTSDDSELTPDAPYAGVSSRVSAVVDMYGVSNLLTRQEVDASGKPTGVLRDATSSRVLGCGRDECPDKWKKASPVSHVHKDAPPFLIFHGTGDTTVDYKQSVELADSLKAVGAKYTLQLIDGAPHTFDLQSSGTDLRQMVIDFLKQNLRCQNKAK